jgi:hypothetical protein
MVGIMAGFRISRTVIGACVPRNVAFLAFALLAAALPYSAFFGSNCSRAAEKHGMLRVVADVPLPGPAVRFDYQSLNPGDGRLYIAHMNADQLVVFDTRSRQVIANLDGFHRVHGVIIVPELGRIFASATGDHQVNVVDSQTHLVYFPLEDMAGKPVLRIMERGAKDH